MAEMKKSANMNENDTNKVLLDTEKKESIRPEMTSIRPKIKMAQTSLQPPLP
jgi:hypothetical protein